MILRASVFMTWLSVGREFFGSSMSWPYGLIYSVGAGVLWLWRLQGLGSSAGSNGVMVSPL